MLVFITFQWLLLLVRVAGDESHLPGGLVGNRLPSWLQRELKFSLNLPARSRSPPRLALQRLQTEQSGAEFQLPLKVMPAGALVGEIVVPTSEGTNETLSMLFDSGSRFTWVPGPRGHVRPDGSFLPTDVNGQRPEIVDYVTGEVKFQSRRLSICAGEYKIPDIRVGVTTAESFFPFATVPFDGIVGLNKEADFVHELCRGASVDFNEPRQCSVSIIFPDANVAKLSACAGECKRTNPPSDVGTAWFTTNPRVARWELTAQEVQTSCLREVPRDVVRLSSSWGVLERGASLVIDTGTVDLGIPARLLSRLGPVRGRHCVFAFLISDENGVLHRFDVNIENIMPLPDVDGSEVWILGTSFLAGKGLLLDFAKSRLGLTSLE